MQMNKLEACIYCKGSSPKNKRMAKRLQDTRSNRAREVSLYRFLSRGGSDTEVTGHDESKSDTRIE